MANDTIIPGFDSDKDDSLKIELKTIAGVDGGLTLILTGYIDTYNSNSFQKRVQRVIDHGYKRLIFNCGGLNYVSSTGIGSFTAFLKTLKGIGGDLVLLDVQPKVYEVFQLLGFSQFFNIRDNQDDAENCFRGGDEMHSNTVFPHNFNCPICSKRLKAVKSGRFRCSECKTILAVDDTGKVFLG
ncbi:MAG: anti-sigma factor antagonist [Spirochaetaceae bacterium]|jgi:anti-anti-sigma factor|nr:anti-sigma factor antagonist [Spirochaetaceae bacterium]